MQSPQGQFIWHELVTSDVKAALAFYGHVVGWTSSVMPMGDGGSYHVLSAGGRGMGGITSLADAGMGATTKPGWVGYIGSNDVDPDATRLQKAGGTVHRPPADIPQVGRFAPVSDPQGAGFILFKPGPPAGEVPPPAEGLGTVGWSELQTTDWKAAFEFYQALFGWQKAEAMDIGAMGTYQIFSTASVPVGGMMNRAQANAAPHWLYFFKVDAIDAAVTRVTSKGGKILEGAMEGPGGSWTLRCQDPQGGQFALLAPKR